MTLISGSIQARAMNRVKVGPCAAGAPRRFPIVSRPGRGCRAGQHPLPSKLDPAQVIMLG